MSKYSPFLLEIRKRIFFTLFVFVVSSASGFVFYEKIIKFSIGVLGLKGINIVFTSPFQFINLAASSGIMVGLIIAFPLFIFQILFFLKSALRREEYRVAAGLLPLSIVLFLTGFAFGVWIMKWQIQIFLARSVSLGIGNILDISHLLSMVLVTAALIGIGFQFPIILFMLMYMGIIKRQQLSKSRPWIYLGSLLVVILLPLDSVLTDILLTLPLIILFELTLVLNRLVLRKN